MRAAEALERSLVIAEQARVLDLKRLVDHLLIFGRVADGEVLTARCIVASMPLQACDLGLVHARHSRVRDWLEHSMTGWAVTRVASGKLLRGPLPGDVDLARERLRALGYDPALALHEQARAS